MYRIEKNYRENPKLRNSFNELAKMTFGIDFEPWYQKGYWTDNYQPYSIVDDETVVANVSVNRTNMIYQGKKLQLIQLGTVMTLQAYRKQGLIRRIMEEIEKDFAEEADGWYLWGNDDVVDFYPKFGFKASKEYQYSKKVDIKAPATIKRLEMAKKEEWCKLEQAVKEYRSAEKFQLTENSGLIFFYLSGFMQENIYFDEKNGYYVIAELEGENLFLYGVFGQGDVNLDNIISTFGPDIKTVTLGFTPENNSRYQCEERKEEDSTLFVKGDILRIVEEERMMFPTLAHA